MPSNTPERVPLTSPSDDTLRKMALFTGHNMDLLRGYSIIQVIDGVRQKIAFNEDGTMSMTEVA